MTKKKSRQVKVGKWTLFRWSLACPFLGAVPSLSVLGGRGSLVVRAPRSRLPRIPACAQTQNNFHSTAPRFRLCGPDLGPSLYATKAKHGLVLTVLSPSPSGFESTRLLDIYSFAQHQVITQLLVTKLVCFSCE